MNYNNVIKSKLDIYSSITKFPLMTTQQCIAVLKNCEQTQLTELEKADQELIKVSSLFTDTEIKNLSQNKVCYFLKYDNKFYDMSLNLGWQEKQIPKNSQVLRNDQDNSIMSINAIAGG